jgi:hypothetical protein
LKKSPAQATSYTKNASLLCSWNKIYYFGQEHVNDLNQYTMIPRLLICVALVFIIISSVAQNSKQPSRSFNSIYDSLIINDSDIPVSEYQDTLPVRDSLVYDPWRSYDSKNLKQILDGAKYTDREKINFIKAAINNTSKDIFRSTIETEIIEFWHKNAQAQLLMLNYFMKLACDQSDDPKIHFRYFDFVTINTLPGAAEMIEEYIKSRPFLKIKYPDEIKLVYRVIRAGSEKNALDLLQLLVAEYTGDKGPRYSWGQRNDDSNVFDLLCFSNNKTIRTEAIQLLWTCLDKEINDDLFDLGSYLDEKRAAQCLEKRFQYYTTLDLGKIEPADLNKANYSLREPLRVSPYFRFMRFYSWRLGNTMGKQLLAEFMNRIPYWDFYKGSQKFIYQTDIIEEAFKDSSITEKERRQMLFDLKIGSFNLDDLIKRDLSSHGSFRQYTRMMVRYLKMVQEAYPDGNIGEDDSTRLYLRDIKKPVTSEQTYPKYYVNMAAAVSDLKQLGLAKLKLQPDLPGYWTFKWTLAPFNHFISPFLWETGLVSHFDPPYRSKPVSNKELFNLYFEPLLAKKGITDIDVQEITASTPDKNLKKVFVRSKDGIYVREYVAAEYGRDQVHKLAKMINLLLMKKNIKERLIEIEQTQFTVDYGVFEPEKLKVFLNRYSDNSYELDKVSMLMEIK